MVSQLPPCSPHYGRPLTESGADQWHIRIDFGAVRLPSESRCRRRAQHPSQALGLVGAARVPRLVTREPATVHLGGRDIFDDQAAAVALPATRWRVGQRPKVVRYTAADGTLQQFDHVIECTGWDVQLGVNTEFSSIEALPVVCPLFSTPTSSTPVPSAAGGILTEPIVVATLWRPSPLAQASSSERHEY